MQTRALGGLALVCLVSTVIWLVLLISGLAGAGPVNTFDQVLGHIAGLSPMFYATYANAAIVTITAVMLYAGLYLFFKPTAPVLATLAFAFVPVYGAMNLVVYLSQITIVPRLIHLSAAAGQLAFAHLLLKETVQQWPDSAVSIVNNLAYAVLGIPSIVYGVLMIRTVPRLRLAGVLLALNGVACIVGFVGIAAGGKLLGNGSLIGGVMFLLALAAMSWVLLSGDDVATVS